MSCDYFRGIPVARVSSHPEDNPIWKILGSAISNVVAVALSIPILLGFLLLLPACLSVRWLLLFIHCNRHGSRSGPGPESVRGNDSRWLGTEWRSSVIHVVLVFEPKEGVNVDHFRRLLLKRVIPLYPRLTQRLISLPISAGVGNCWLKDSKFSIEDHVFPGPSFLTNEKELQGYVSKLVEDGLPEDKPPWQLQVFQSFGTHQDTVVVLRIHQSVADGTVLMRLLCHSLADSQVIEVPERPRFGTFGFCMNFFRACIIGPITLLLWLFLAEDDCNLLTHRSSWTGSVTVTWSASIMLPKIVRIKQVTRSTVNCVLLSALAGALRQLLQGKGVKQPSNVRVNIPMDLRNQTSSTPMRTKLGNKTSSMTLPLPVAVEGCIPRLWATRKNLESLRSSADPVILYVATAALMSVASAPFVRDLVNFFTDKATLQFSSLPGPTSEIFLEGQTLKGIYPILPAQANLGISVTTMTYADQVFVSVIAERALGPAAGLILEYLEDQIEVLWTLLLHRRVPGEPDSPTIFTKSSISESPVKEITSRLSLVQKEVERLSEGKDNDKEVKLCTLKAEFSELVEELKRRQSLSEIEDSDPYLIRQRAFSTSSFKKQLSISPKPFRQHFSPSDTTNHVSKKVSEKASGNIKQQNVSSQYKIPKFESLHKSAKCNSSNSQDCVINISESKGSSKMLFCHSNKSNHSQRKSESNTVNAKELSDFSWKNKADVISEKPKRKTRSNNDVDKSNGQENPKFAETKFSVLSKSLRDDKKDSKLEMENPRVFDPDRQDNSDNQGPNELLCDLRYKNYLEVVKVKEKQLVQVPKQRLEIKSEDKFDDPEESEIVGGVLI